MAEQRKTKTCSMCLEEIDDRARRCPHCRHPQGKAAGWTAAHPFKTILTVSLLAVGLLVLMVVYIKSPSPLAGRKHLATFAGEVKVVSSRMVFGTSGDRPVACVVGKLRNGSDITWKNLRLEAEFLDANGEVIDLVVGPELFFVSELLPRGETGFKVRTVCDLPVEAYASYKLHVRFAKDARAFP